MLNRWIQAREGFFGELRRLALPIIFQNLIEHGATVIVIEHDLDALGIISRGTGTVSP